MTEATFASSWDGKLVLTTLVFGLLLLGGGALAVSSARSENLPAAGKLALLLAGLLPWGAFLAAAAGSPLRIKITKDALLIERRCGAARIALTAVSAVEIVPPSSISGSVRTFGVYGLFGHFGSFRNSKLGDYKMYATRSDSLVVVRTSEGPVILSPDDPGALLESLRARLAVSPGEGRIGEGKS